MTTLLKILIAVLFALSAWWEISLFASLAGTAMHALQIGTFAVCLVAGQLLFADQAAIMWQQGNKALAVAAAAVVVTLMAVSVNGNALYFETQFQVAHQHETANDDGHQQIRADIASTQAEREHFLALSKKEQDTGNRWIAGQHLKSATAAGETLAQLRAELSAAKATASKTGTAGVLNQAVGTARTGLFYLFALLTDLLPVLALVLLRNQTPTTAKNTDKQMPEQQPIATAKQPKQLVKQLGQPHATAEPCGLKALIDQTGQMPSWSMAKAAGFSYTSYKRERDELLQAGLIIQDGQGYRLREAA